MSDWTGGQGDQCHDCGQWREVNDDTLCHDCWEFGGYADAEDGDDADGLTSDSEA